MNTTINLSLPKGLLDDIKKAVQTMNYSSVSELLRDAARDKIYKKQERTVNGFTPEFEEEVLRIAATSDKNDTLVTTEKELDDFLSSFS